MVCAGARVTFDQNETECNPIGKGDSGGPLACQNPEGSFVLWGVVSFGDDCREDLYTPSVFHLVSKSREWIFNTIATLEKQANDTKVGKDSESKKFGKEESQKEGKKEEHPKTRLFSEIEKERRKKGKEKWLEMMRERHKIRKGRKERKKRREEIQQQKNEEEAARGGAVWRKGRAGEGKKYGGQLSEGEKDTGKESEDYTNKEFESLSMKQRRDYEDGEDGGTRPAILYSTQNAERGEMKEMELRQLLKELVNQAWLYGGRGWDISYG